MGHKTAVAEPALHREEHPLKDEDLDKLLSKLRNSTQASCQAQMDLLNVIEALVKNGTSTVVVREIGSAFRHTVIALSEFPGGCKPQPPPGAPGAS